ncbi:MAG TPA: DUF6502 family protein [Burkholderiaceae bacterium]
MQSALATALARLLRPLVRLLLRHAVPYSAFDAVARRVYVEAAMEDFALPGRKPTASRASILTGLTRKDVQRLLAEPAAPAEAASAQYNRAARVLGAWVRETEYRDGQGAARALEIDGDGGFAQLVRRHSGDMPVRAVLDELVRMGAVREREDGRVELVQRAFVPQASTLQKINILGADVAALVDTIDHNIEHGATDPRYQRKVMHVGIPVDVLPAFRELSAAHAQALLEKLDAWLSPRDLKHLNLPAGATPPKTARVGLGIYYFEQVINE